MYKYIITILLMSFSLTLNAQENIAVSNNLIANLTRSIVGFKSKIQVINTIADSISLESLNDIQNIKMKSCDLFITNNNDHESFVKDIKIISLDRLSQKTNLDDSSKVTLLSSSFWLDPINTVMIIQKLTDTLSVLYPENKELYSNNFEIFKSKLEFLDLRITKMLKNIVRRPVYIIGDGLEEYCNKYQIPIKSSFRNNDSIEKLIKEIKQDKNKKIIFSTNRFKKLSEVIKEKTYSRITYIDVFGDQNKSYLDLMINITKAIKQTLKY